MVMTPRPQAELTRADPDPPPPRPTMDATARLLVIDDDPKFLDYVSRGLRHSGLSCVTASSPDEALQILERPDDPGFDLLLLDVMMPSSSGWDLLEALRGRGLNTPTIFVTARDAVEERVKGLELGADDYIIKPFAFQELLARIQAVLRRHDAWPVLEHASMRIDPAQRRVQRGDAWIELSQREFDLLLYLVRNRGRILSRKELLERVWGIDFDPGTNVVDVLVGRLRRRLDAHGPPWIVTVTGEGYRLAEGADE